MHMAFTHFVFLNWEAPLAWRQHRPAVDSMHVRVRTAVRVAQSQALIDTRLIVPVMVAAPAVRGMTPG